MILNISEEFTDAPGGRKISEGPYSGELFLHEYLLSKYNKSIENNEKLIIDFDNCYGFTDIFLDEVFSNLIHITKNKNILDNIDIICNDDPTIKHRIIKSIS